MPGRERGPLERALDELWKKARMRLYMPRHLFTWLDLSRRFDLHFVRTSELEIAIPRGLVPDCEACVEICCTGPNARVSLRLVDIAALVDAGLEEHIVHEPPAAERLTFGTWAAKELGWSVFSRCFPVLRRDATGTCTLLTEDRLCGAYPAWPLSCARYPYSLDVLHRRLFLAKGCQSHRFVTVDDVPGKVRGLVEAAVRSYNERIKDIILLHVALEELDALGLLRFLRLEGKLAQKAGALAVRHRGPTSSLDETKGIKADADA